MTTYKPGDILLVPFPFTDQSQTKRRPSVVLSSEPYNATHPDVILAPVTSQVGYVLDEVALVDWQASGLMKPSAVKPVLSSFDTRLVRRLLGPLSSSDLQAVREMFAKVLELS